MDIGSIETEHEYNRAIVEIGRYFDAQPEIGSPDGERFDALAALIAAYEDRNYPIQSRGQIATK